ncbi:WbqC family protein [Candidatus Gracilibacteria bacterium]|nr:WbqC family protein [Candidatus Gracilibacteria bacterium]
MICSIHQPNYIPYLGLFNKIKQSDVFVIYDIAQYTKGDYHNRNKVKGSNGEVLLTLPVFVNFGQEIKDVRFNNSILKKHFQTIEQNYKKAKFYNDYITKIKEIYDYKGDSISEFNTITIKKICELLGIKTKFIILSDLINSMESKNTDALIDICKLVGATEYISGAGGKNYIEESKFTQAGIILHYQDYHHPNYNQLWGDFIPYMSIIDLILNEGENSINLI